MSLTLLLAKVFGLALIAAGIALLVKRDFFAKITRDFLQQDLLRLVISFSEMVAGLFIVIGHNRWSPMPAAVITFLGWVFVLEGASYLLLPEKWAARFINAVNRPHFFTASGIIGIVLGIYLADYGFALWPRFQ
ncbi:MAG: hypothetical protein K2P86_13115 [Xanthobacteraceae bacterium]|nr:hypothetical protein [Xanthobacteraceae bacterium]